MALSLSSLVWRGWITCRDAWGLACPEPEAGMQASMGGALRLWVTRLLSGALRLCGEDLRDLDSGTGAELDDRGVSRRQSADLLGFYERSG
jgi:hypothetical protein